MPTGTKKTLAGPHRRADRDLAVLSKALGHPTRVAILRFLCRRGGCICGAIVDQLPFAQATISQHLKVLKEAGLVTDHAAGTRRVYSVDTAGIAAIRDYFERFWQQSLDRFRAAASQPVLQTQEIQEET